MHRHLLHFIVSATVIMTLSREALGQGVPTGLQAGDAFSARIIYSNMWTEYKVIIPVRRPSSPSTGGSIARTPTPPKTNVNSMSRRNPLRTPGHTRPPSRLTGKDPLFVMLGANIKVADDLSLDLEMVVRKVHYFDGYGNKWTVYPHQNAGSVPWARNRAGKLSVKWKNPATNGIKRETLREQLLGLAIICFDKVCMKGRIDPVCNRVCLPDFRKTALKQLGEAFPYVFQSEAQVFFAEAIDRLLVQEPLPLVKKAEFKYQEITHRIENVYPRHGRPTVRLSACENNLSTGMMIRSAAEVDVKTGLVLKSSFLSRRDAYRRNSSTRRLQIHRWETTFLGFEENKTKEITAAENKKKEAEKSSDNKN